MESLLPVYTGKKLSVMCTKKNSTSFISLECKFCLTFNIDLFLSVFLLKGTVMQTI